MAGGTSAAALGCEAGRCGGLSLILCASHPLPLPWRCPCGRCPNDPEQSLTQLRLSPTVHKHPCPERPFVQPSCALGKKMGALPGHTRT